MWPSSNEYWSVDSGKTAREAATHHIQAPLASADRGARGARDLLHLGVALCAVSTLMVGSAVTLAFLYLF